MPSLLNGLSALGAGVAQFAGQSGLELQRAQLAQQQTVLADQLATTRETGLQASGGAIAAAAAAKQQAFETGQTQQTLAAAAARVATEQAGESGRNAATIAAESARQRQLLDAEMERARYTANAPTPEMRDVAAFSGGAQPGTPEYQRAVFGQAAAKLGIPPDLYGTPGSGGTAPAGGSTSGAATPNAALPGPRVGKSPTSDAGSAYTPQATPLDNGPPPGGYNEAVLAGKPAWLVAKVHAINEGREEPPNPRSQNDYKSPEFVANQLLHEYNPKFDATLYPVRLEAQKAIAPGGSLFTAVSAMNTSMGHIDHLGSLYAELGNLGGGTLVNAPLNLIAANTGHYPVINAIKQTVDAMATEGNRIYSGNAGTESEIDSWKKTFPLNGSLADQQRALQNFAQLMGAKFETLATQVNAAAGYPGRGPIELLTPKAKATYQRQTTQAQPTGAVVGGAPPTLPSGRLDLAGRPTAAPAAPAAAQPAAPPRHPALPSWVKPGDQYSPTLNQALGADGKPYGAPR